MSNLRKFGFLSLCLSAVFLLLAFSSSASAGTIPAIPASYIGSQYFIYQNYSGPSETYFFCSHNEIAFKMRLEYGEFRYNIYEPNEPFYSTSSCLQLWYNMTGSWVLISTDPDYSMSLDTAPGRFDCDFIKTTTDIVVAEAYFPDPIPAGITNYPVCDNGVYEVSGYNDVIWDSGGYDYIGWSNNMFLDRYFYIVGQSHYHIVSDYETKEDNYIFDVETGNGIFLTFGLKHHENTVADYYDDQVTIERLDAMRGNVVYTHIDGTDISYVEDDDFNFWIYGTFGQFLDNEIKYYVIRYHNLADTETFKYVYFAIRGDVDYWISDETNVYDMCEKYDSAWTRAICHAIVPSTGFFANEFQKVKNSMFDAFPALRQMRAEAEMGFNAAISATYNPPVIPASSSWAGVGSVQIWDMSVVSPYAETFRGYISIVLWALFIVWFLHELISLFQTGVVVNVKKTENHFNNNM